MTQAAVSYQIKVLEDRIGSPLFVRLPRQVVLTPSGSASRRRSPRPSRCCASPSRGTGRVVDNVISISVICRRSRRNGSCRGSGASSSPIRGFAVQLDASNEDGRFRTRRFRPRDPQRARRLAGARGASAAPEPLHADVQPGAHRGRRPRGPGRHPEAADPDRRGIPGGRNGSRRPGVGAVDLSDRPDHSSARRPSRAWRRWPGRGSRS